MKKIKCSDVGGPCDHAITAETKEEMMQKMWEHYEKTHPEDAEKVKAMPKEEVDKWTAMFNQKWDETPDLTQEEMEEERNVEII